MIASKIATQIKKKEENLQKATVRFKMIASEMKKRQKKKKNLQNATVRFKMIATKSPKRSVPSFLI